MNTSRPSGPVRLQATEDSSSIESEIDRCIAETLPRGPGQRNNCIFHFARALKGVAAFADAEPKDLWEYVRHWHQRALPFTSGTKDVETTYFEFVYAWNHVKWSKGAFPMAAIVEKALAAGCPPEAAHYENDGIKKVAAICRELQRECGDAPFFLSSRTAAQLLNLDDHTATWRWLRILEIDGILKCVDRGNARRAPRYRYVAPLSAAVPEIV